MELVKAHLPSSQREETLDGTGFYYYRLIIYFFIHFYPLLVPFPSGRVRDGLST